MECKPEAKPEGASFDRRIKVRWVKIKQPARSPHDKMDNEGILTRLRDSGPLARLLI